jgi:hypothetical protein
MIHPYHRKLARVLDRMGGLYTLHDILDAIAAGRMQSFMEGDSWAITRVMDHPRGRSLEVFAVVGSIDDLRVLHDRLMTYAFEIGATVIKAYGRKGFLNDAQQRGWKVKARSFVYQREVTDE